MTIIFWIGLVCLLLAAFQLEVVPHVSLGWLGLFLIFLTQAPGLPGIDEGIITILVAVALILLIILVALEIFKRVRKAD